jgi:hypothetical protein
LLPKRGCVADHGASAQPFSRPGGAPGLYIPISELTGGYAIGCDIRGRPLRHLRNARRSSIMK